MIMTTLRLMAGRIGNLLGSLVAFTLAITFMLATVSILVSTLDGPGTTVRFGDADLIVRVDAGAALDVPADALPESLTMRLPEEAQEAIAAVPGVREIIPLVEIPAQVLSGNGTPVAVPDEATPLGQAWSSAALTPFTIQDGRAPASTEEIVVEGRIARSGDIRLGDAVMVATGVDTGRYTVVGVAVPPDGDRLERQATVFFHDDRADELAASSGAADLVGVIVQDDADPSEVARAIDRIQEPIPLDVLAGDERGKVDAAAGNIMVRDMGALFGVMAGFVGFVTIFVLASTFGFAVQQRRREIGLLRAIGYTPKQVRRSILIEALAISAVGSVIGLLLARSVARLVVEIMISWDKLAGSFEVRPSEVASLIVIPSGAAIALLAAWIASRKTATIAPLETLQEAAVPKPRLGFWRLVWGVLVLAAGGLCVLLSGSVPATVGVMFSLGVIVLLSIACVLLGPLVVRIGARLVMRIPGFPMTEPDALAAHNTLHQSFRMASVVMPIVLAVGMTTMMFGFTSTQEAAMVQVTDERMAADLYLVPETGELPRELVIRVGEIPGVASITMATTLEVGIGEGRDGYFPYQVMAVDAETIHETMRLEVNEGTLDAFGPGTIVVDRMAELDVPGSLGTTSRVLFPDGTLRDLEWVATTGNLAGAGDALLSIDDLPAGFGVSLGMVNLEAGASVDDVVSNIDALRADGLAVSVLTHDQYVGGVGVSIQQEGWASNLIIGSAAAFGALAAFNTLVMSISERSREFALMRMIGATRGQVLRMICAESIILTLIAVVLGAVVGLASLTPVSVGITGDAGALRVSVVGVGLTVALAFASIVGIALLAVRPALRSGASTAISVKE